VWTKGWIVTGLLMLAAPMVGVVALEYQRSGVQGRALSALGVYYAALAVAAAAWTVHEARAERRDRSRPHIYVDFPMTPEHEVFVRVVNGGGGVARQVRIVFDPSPVDHKGRKVSDLSLFRGPISFLLPNEDRQHLFQMSHDLREPVAFAVTASCLDADDEPCGPWTYTVNLEEQRDITGPRRTTPQWLGKIDKKLEEAVRAIERLSTMTVRVEAPSSTEEEPAAGDSPDPERS